MIDCFCQRGPAATYSLRSKVGVSVKGFDGNTHGYSWDLITSDRSYGKPIMNIEFYYEAPEASGTHPHHADADTVRKGAWHVMLNGASGLA